MHRNFKKHLTGKFERSSTKILVPEETSKTQLISKKQGNWLNAHLALFSQHFFPQFQEENTLLWLAENPGAAWEEICELPS